MALEIRRLIRQMSLANPLWGALRIHGELPKLGIDIGQTSVAKYMAPRRRPPSQGWRTFLLNHADGIASIDLFVVPTISFRLLYGLLVLGHGRRRIMWLGVTAHPTAEWIARQITEACGWEAVPTYLVRDRDRVYGEAFTRRTRAMGIRDRPTAPRSPWQNGYAERLIGSIRRECLDHVDHSWRAASASCSAFLPAILQRHSNASVAGQGLAANEIGPTPRDHSPRCPSSADCTIITSGSNFRQAQLNEQTRGRRPNYYLQKFHFQTGGWMTEDFCQALRSAGGGALLRDGQRDTTPSLASAL